MTDPQGWHSRGFLPHYDDGTTIQVITHRLWDALPALVLQKLEQATASDADRRAEIDRYLDAGYGTCLLSTAAVAEMVLAAWQHFDAKRYRLHAWAIMPNHVHVMIEPLGVETVSDIVQSQKSYTAKRILALPVARELQMERHVWQADYFDRFIRNEEHYEKAVSYIHENPVKAGLVSAAVDWPWSSARDWERGPRATN